MLLPHSPGITNPASSPPPGSGRYRSRTARSRGVKALGRGSGGVDCFLEGGLAKGRGKV
jgi:hypothetical protein